MPVAIKMANGTAYYPEGFQHFGFGKSKSSGGTYVSNSRSGGGRESEYMRRYNTYGQYWADKGEDPVPNPDSGSPIKWVSRDTAAKMQRSIDEGAFDYAGSGRAGTVSDSARNFVKNAPNKLKYEGAKIRAGYGRGTYDYDQAHKNADGTQGGNKFGRTMAGVGGAVKSSAAYKAGAAAVKKAGEMLANGPGRVIRGEMNRVKRGGDMAVYKYNREHTYKDGRQGGNAIGRTAARLKGMMKYSAAGQAALKAGGAIVGAVGKAINRIKDFFNSASNKWNARNNAPVASPSIDEERRNQRSLR